jgi:uncharacterized membrane protein YkvA (DUF1232 family)
MAKEATSDAMHAEATGDRLREKLRRYARAAGRTVVERALRLYYASQDPSTPVWAKRAIYSGLAYFVVPFDLVPDFSRASATDDAATLLTSRVSAYVSRHTISAPPRSPSGLASRRVILHAERTRSTRPLSSVIILLRGRPVVVGGTSMWRRPRPYGAPLRVHRPCRR